MVRKGSLSRPRGANEKFSNDLKELLKDVNSSWAERPVCASIYIYLSIANISSADDSTRLATRAGARLGFLKRAPRAIRVRANDKDNQ